MRVSTMIVGTIFGAMFSQAGMAADDFLDVSRLYGEFNAGNPGNEQAVPRWTYVDANSDGYPEAVNVWLDTYAAGTATKLYSSTMKQFALPAIPVGCSPTQAAQGLNWNPKLLRGDSSSRIHVAMSFELDCWDASNNHLEASTTAIYSASVASAGGAPWKYSWAGVFLVGVNGIDTDGDLINDSLLVLQAYDVAGGGATNVMGVTITGATGAVTSKAHYPVVVGEY